jgi:beta-xylosidase
VESGWQVVLRSRNIYGPYEDKIVLEQGNTAINGPHQGALVDAADGSWWFVYFQDAGVYGRIVHLQPVKWQADWPLIGQDREGIREPVLQHAKPGRQADGAFLIPQTSDEFDATTLGLQWQWQANHQDDWYKLDERASRLRLYPQFTSHENLTQLPNLLLQKFPARSFAVETLMDSAASQTGTEAGLVVMGRAHAALAVQRCEHGRQVVLRVNNIDQFSCDIPSATVKLRVEVKDGGQCQFSYAINGEFVHVPEIFHALEGEWIGAKLGLYSLKIDGRHDGGHTDFGYFRFA